MLYGKHVVDGEVRLVRIKRRGPKNCRVIWLESGEDYLVPRPQLVEITPEEAGVAGGTTSTPEELPPLPELSELPTLSEISEPPAPSEEEEVTLAADEVYFMMNKHRVTIKQLAEKLGISVDEVRRARREGVQGTEAVNEWKRAITGQEDSVAIAEAISS